MAPYVIARLALGDKVSVKSWIELHKASMKLNINWNPGQAATAQQNLVLCHCILNDVLHYTKINK